MESHQIINSVAKNLNLNSSQVKAVISLKDEGCTIPFISRYRKERTGNLDEIRINDIIENFNSVNGLEKRREYIHNFISGAGKMTVSLDKKIKEAGTLNELEDLYLPFKPGRKTLADRARELGLEPLAELVARENLDRAAALEKAEKFIGNDVPDRETALDHALSIIIQDISDSPEVRKEVREDLKKGKITSSVKRGKKEEGEKYRDYFDYSEDVSRIPSHRIMALLRGNREKALNIIVVPSADIEDLKGRIAKIRFGKDGELLNHCTGESLSRHLLKSLGNDILREIREKAEKDSVDIFSRNLENILLAPPLGEKPVIGIDPGIRTGCKAAAIDRNGEFMDFMTINLQRNPTDAGKLLPWVEKYKIRGIAVGDGTFGRESYAIIKELFAGSDMDVVMVDEDGASVYSAGETAREEFPHLDVTARGAISIGRRLQDPLAELVKIEPRSLGVGQYQHDITPVLLREKLKQTVEWAVNKIGVNLNTAGYHLLSYVSGIDAASAREIVRYRKECGGFGSRETLRKVKGIGERAFQQCAGFLRIKEGENLLDSTGVHPESYESVSKIAEYYKVEVDELAEKPEIIKVDDIRISLDIDELESIVGELKSRGLDPREKFTGSSFSDDIESIDDLKEGMVLAGMVDNVAAFGAFVNLGIKEKGLVHISEVSSEYVKDINSVLSVGDTVAVKVMAVDRKRKRISLSIKEAGG